MADFQFRSQIPKILRTPNIQNAGIRYKSPDVIFDPLEINCFNFHIQ